jgi:chromosome segregation ATPase
MKNFLNRITGRERRHFMKELIQTQNLLNARINEVDSLERLNEAYGKRIALIEKAMTYHEREKHQAFEKNKMLNKELELCRDVKDKALVAVREANAKIKEAEGMVFEVNQDLASKNADLNDMLDTVSRLEQKIKELSMPKVAPSMQIGQSQVGQKINNIRNKKRPQTK